MSRAPYRLLVADPPRAAVLHLAPIEVDRVERHAGLVAALAEGRLSSDDFAQDAGALFPLAGGLRLLANPAAALALVDELRAQDLDLGETE
jgi:hypothetical protein